MPVSSEQAMVTFKGGFVAEWSIVHRLLDLEARGARFELVKGGRFRVIPPHLLSSDDVAFLREHRDQARLVIEYQADVAHLFCDGPGGEVVARG